MFINNKYKTWHDNIITKAKNRTLTCYTEKHHIIPKCLGGSNNEDNLVRLTAKEHFMVHMLLCKFTEGKVKQKMYYAFNAMSSMKQPKNKRQYRITSKIAQKLREEYAIYFKANNPSFREDVKIKIGLAHKGKKTISPKYWTGKKLSDAHKENIRLGGLGKNKGKEYYWVKNETSSKLIKRNELNDYLNLGYKQGRLNNYVTDEFIKVQSEKRTAYWNRKKAHAL